MPITFRYDQEKANQVVLWFLGEHGGRLPRLKLIKLVFYVDREHLHQYGRPVVGGQYKVLPHGPVSQDLYDDIQSPGAANLPYRNEGDDVLADRSANEDLLSESDIEALKKINERYGAVDKWRLVKKTHSLKAYTENFKKDAGENAFELPYEDFFLDLPNNGMLESIHDDQEAWGPLN